MSLCDENNVMDLSAFRLAVRGAFNPDGTEFVPIIRPCEPGALDRVSLLRHMANTGPKGTHSMTIPVQRPRRVCPPEGRCLICSLDEHTSSECPYNTEVPKNATVGRGCDIFCKVCDGLLSGRCCNQDSGRAKLKFCNFCCNYGEHWMEQCPLNSLKVEQCPLNSLKVMLDCGPSSGYLREKSGV